MIINCIAVDDEPLALEKMKTYISKVEFLNLLETFDNGVDAVNYLKTKSVDLIFLDIQMEDFTGIQLLESLKERPKVILTTAYDQYALKGYELDVSDYLLKPISFPRFLKSVEKVYNSFDKKEDHTIELSKEFIFVKSDYKLQKVRFDDIQYIEGMKDYLRIVTPQKRLMVLQNFKKMEEILPDKKFIRVHKSYIIAINKIESIGKKKPNNFGSAYSYW